MSQIVLQEKLAAAGGVPVNNLETLVRELGQATGLSHLALDDKGRCTLMFDDLTVVEISQDEAGRRVTLSATVCDYTPAKELPVLRELAAANLDGVGTGGAVLAANTRDRYVVLQHHEPLQGLEWSRFSRLISDVLDATEYWRKRLDALSDALSLPEAHLPPTIQRA